MICPFRQNSDPFAARGLRAALFSIGLIIGAMPASLAAQSGGLGGFSVPDVPVLTIEPDRLFAETQFGQRLSSEIEARGTQLAAENRRIEAELADEESRLTALRETTDPAAFRLMADEFDKRVTSVRGEQDAKARGLAVLTEQAQRGFLRDIAPILESVMNERGGSVVLDRRAVFYSTDASDISDTLIARIDERLGEGRSLQELQDGAPAQDAAPEQ